MTLIKKPSELTNKPRLKGLIYGQPGVGKTTVALSAPSPILIDFDKGLHRVSKRHQVDSVQIESYQDLLDILTKEDISAYQTIVIDTAGKMVIRIGEWLIKNNPKLGQSDGTLSQKGWGTVKAKLQDLLKILDAKNKSVIFIAHEKEEKKEDRILKRIDISGSSSKDIVQELDFMGYMSVVGGKRTIDFSPQDDLLTKNSLNLDHFLEFPSISGKNDFLTKAIFETYSQKTIQDNKLREDYDILTSRLDNRISQLASKDEINEYLANELGKLHKIWSSDIYEKNSLIKQGKKFNLVFNKESKLFEEVQDAR